MLAYLLVSRVYQKVVGSVWCYWYACVFRLHVAQGRILRHSKLQAAITVDNTAAASTVLLCSLFAVFT